VSIVNERDKQVLLIDADVARPSVARVLGIETSVGLIDYLDRNDVAFSDVVLRTSLPGLSLVVAGRQHKHSTELLSSNKMMLLAEELSSKYPDRLVILIHRLCCSYTGRYFSKTSRSSCIGNRG